MALIKSALKGQLMMRFMGHSSDPMKPGKDIAKSFAIYLKGGQNAGGFPTSGVTGEAPAGIKMGKTFSSQLPTGVQVGQEIADALSQMAQTYLSTNQTGPPIAPPSHLPQLMKLFSGYAGSGLDFAKELADILDTWTKTWVVNGVIPGSPPVPFSGPLS